jgi:hypothetical protein
MAEIVQNKKIVSQDDRISVLMSFLLPGEPIRINLSGKTGVLMDEEAYDGLLETIRVLQENPSIVKSLDEQDNGVFTNESEQTETLTSAQLSAAQRFLKATQNIRDDGLTEEDQAALAKLNSGQYKLKHDRVLAV